MNQERILLCPHNDLELRTPKDFNEICNLLIHLEVYGIPAGGSLPRYLIKSQGRKFGDSFYKRIGNGVKFGEPGIEFGISNPLDHFAMEASSFGYMLHHTEDIAEIWMKDFAEWEKYCYDECDTYTPSWLR